MVKGFREVQWKAFWVGCYIKIGRWVLVFKNERKLVNIIQLHQEKAMSFVYSFYPSYHPVTSDFYSLISHQQQQLKPTTIIVSNFQNCSDSVQKNDYHNQVLPTTTSSLDQLSPLQPKKAVKLEKKASKKGTGSQKDQNFGWRNQNKDRNVLSGILKGYVHFALSNQSMIKLIQNLSKKLSLQNGFSSFYRFITEAFPQKKSYIGIKYMREVLRAESTPKEMRHMLAMTLRCYLREVYPLSVCLSSKLKRKDKLSLLKKMRNIVELLFQQ